MKNIFKTLSVLFVALSLIGCSKEGKINSDELPVTSDNISGTWKLSTIDSEPLPDGLYMYLELIRRDKKFSFYENISGSINGRPVQKTGRFDFFGDRIISFLYDNSMSSYGKKYEIVSLSEDRMIWVREGDGEVSVYVRCSEIPQLPGLSDDK